MDDFFVRLFTIIIGVGLSLFMLLWNEATFCCFFTVITLICVLEFVHSTSDEIVGKVLTATVAMTISGMLMASALQVMPERYLVLIMPLVGSFFGAEIILKQNYHFANIAYSITCMVWIVVPLALCVFMTVRTFASEAGYEPRFIIGILVVVWFNDAGAYCVGRFAGMTPLHPKLSPKKTWEGIAGGAIAASISAKCIGHYLDLPKLIGGENHWIYITLMCIALGNLGDLVESAFKRCVAIKDTGTLLPGHGGFLDRFDAVLFVVPYVFCYVYLIRQ